MITGIQIGMGIVGMVALALVIVWGCMLAS